MFSRKNRRGSRNMAPPTYYPQSQFNPNQGGNGYVPSYYPNYSPYYPYPSGSNYSSQMPSNPYFSGDTYGGNPYTQFGSNNHQTYPAEWILENPLQPKKNNGGGANPYGANSYPYLHPYPKQGAINRPPTGMNSIMNSFKTQDGQFDLNKMIDTAGQMMNAVSQVSGLVKGLGGIFKV